VSALARENEMLAFYVSHRLGDGEDLASLQAAGGGELVGDAPGEARARLSQAQLLDVAKGCREDVRADAALAKERSLGALSTLQVVVTQAGLRLEGVKALSAEFATAVVARGRSARTGAVTAEAVVKFYEDSLRKRRARTEKLAWKTSVLQRELDRLRGSAKAVSDSSSELVRYITFHQLRIENSQFTAKLAAKSRDLLKLKMLSGFTSDLVAKLKGAWARRRRGEEAAAAQPPPHLSPPTLPPPPHTHTVLLSPVLTLQPSWRRLRAPSQSCAPPSRSARSWPARWRACRPPWTSRWRRRAASWW
jgi:hypothetical protein